MPLILTIDTATEKASVSLAFDGKILQEQINERSMDHAGWIHTAIRDMMQFDKRAYQLRDLAAVAVVAGPGSYTGIRVGMATAKGLCYSLQVPLISLNTLAVMAHATKKVVASPQLLCPMLDARRMEVFTALYDATLLELLPPCAMVLEKDSFSNWLHQYPIVFVGNGSVKWKDLVENENAIFKDVAYNPGDIALMASDAFKTQAFAGLAYTEPVYLKEFYSTQKK